jgi:hypothetical protein
MDDEQTHEQQVQAILNTRDKPCGFITVMYRREAVLINEVDRLRTEREAARAVLAALVGKSPLYVRVGYSHWSCWYCAAKIDNPGRDGGHQTDCPWARAAALLATPPAAGDVAAGEGEGAEG